MVVLYSQKQRRREALVHLSNLWKLSVFRFFYGLIPAYVIERLYWEARGMTIPMVVYVEIIFAVAIVALEVPTGIAADKWGRKRMVVLSALMGCCEFALLVFATSFWHFALVAVLAAIGTAAGSGAADALLYDSLRSAGREEAFEQRLGRLNALDIGSTILAALCGSLLASRTDLVVNYWLSLGSMIVALGASLALSEPPTHGEAARPVPIREYWTAAVRFFRSRPAVRLVVLSGIAAGAAVNFVDEFWQTYLDRVGVPVAYFGLFSAGLFLLRLPGNLLAHALRDRYGYRTLLMCAAVSLSVGFVWLAASRDYGGLPALALVCLSAGLVEPLAAGYLHHRADPAMRATLGSFQSLGENAAVVLLGVGFGYWSAGLDIFGGFGFLGAACVAYAAYFGYAARKGL